jgi:hypothetical protein
MKSREIERSYRVKIREVRRMPENRVTLVRWNSREPRAKKLHEGKEGVFFQLPSETTPFRVFFFLILFFILKRAF